MDPVKTFQSVHAVVTECQRQLCSSRDFDLKFLTHVVINQWSLIYLDGFALRYKNLRVIQCCIATSGGWKKGFVELKNGRQNHLQRILWKHVLGAVGVRSVARSICLDETFRMFGSLTRDSREKNGNHHNQQLDFSSEFHWYYGITNASRFARWQKFAQTSFACHASSECGWVEWVRFSICSFHVKQDVSTANGLKITTILTLIH